MRIGTHAAAVLSLVIPQLLLSQEPPAATDFTESVDVELVQIELSVWPNNGDPAACRGLAADDFDVSVNGRAVEIEALDWLGSPEVMSIIEGVEITDTERPPLTMVLFFDLWHLNLFFRDFTCPMTKPLAFDQARELVREEFRAGDRLLLVTFAGWPQIHEGWIRDPQQALRALDRLEVSPFVLSARREHVHHERWIEGVKSLLLALGHYPGRKEVFYLADDFRFDDIALQVYDLAVRAQANQVTMHAVDLLASCRGLPGPGCPDMSHGGLGCTPFRTPVALGHITKNTGGGLFGENDTLATAVRKVRSLRGCRYLVSFRRPPGRSKRSPRASVRLNRRGLQLHFPSSFGVAAHEPKERERQDSLFLLPRFGSGLRAEVGLWPLSPTGKRKRWRGVIMARLSRSGDEGWTDALEQIEIEAVAHHGSRIYGSYGKVIEGEELQRFRDGESRLFVFPVDGIRPGTVTTSLRVVGVGSDVVANVRSIVDVPDPPLAGQAGPWFVADRLARASVTTTILPALDGVLASDRQALIVGYGCRGESADLGEGKIISLDGPASAPVAIGWLEDAADVVPGGCGWLAGRIEPPLVPGLWRFEPPLGLTSGEAARALEFRVSAGNN